MPAILYNILHVIILQTLILSVLLIVPEYYLLLSKEKINRFYFCKFEISKYDYYLSNCTADFIYEIGKNKFIKPVLLRISRCCGVAR